MGKVNRPRRPRMSIGPPGEPKPFHHITVFQVKQEEKDQLLRCGIELTAEGENACFEIGEQDTRWPTAAALVSLLEHQSSPKLRRVQDIVMTKPTLKESVRAAVVSFAQRFKDETSSKNRPHFESVEDLLSANGYPVDSLVVRLEELIGQKATKDQSSLTDVERVVLAVEALEREANNGGYDQFFKNSSREFATTIVESLRRIGCPRTAKITQKAIDALELSDLTVHGIEKVMASPSRSRTEKLEKCDQAYYKNAEPIAERLFAFVKANRGRVGIESA